MWLRRCVLSPPCVAVYSAVTTMRRRLCSSSSSSTDDDNTESATTAAAGAAVTQMTPGEATTTTMSAAPDIAPRKRMTRPRVSSTRPPLDVDELLRSVPRDPGAHAELSTAELERKVSEWARLRPRELAEAVARLEAQEESSSRVLQDDALYQMDVSLRPRSAGAVRVFWRDVDIVPLTTTTTTTPATAMSSDTTAATAAATTATAAQNKSNTTVTATTASRDVCWYAVTVDGRRVKAFESRRVLALPGEALALCCAKEYATQSGYLNKLLMPLCDLCSGAQHVAPQRLAPRVDYLMSFYHNDNVYFRAAPIAAAQDALVAPVVDWFARTYDVVVPRVVGIGHPHVPAHAVQRVREALLAMNMNPYQMVALCVAAQYTSSLLLPLALFHGVVDVATALRINRAEEAHNVRESGHIAGYHDIRDADAVVKVCACAVAWRMTRDVSLAACMAGPMYGHTASSDGADAATLEEMDEAML